MDVVFKLTSRRSPPILMLLWKRVATAVWTKPAYRHSRCMISRLVGA
jgi:hypothetical protein